MSARDRDLLEIAAKAAGMETNHHWNASRMALSPPVVSLVVHRSGELVSTAWNPLINDGDALRLAATLRISIDHNHPADQNAWVSASDASLRVYAQLEVGDESGRPAETRRAIVQAAAQIGKAML